MAKALRRDRAEQASPAGPRHQGASTALPRGDRPPPPKPPPMRIVTKTLWNITEREATIEEVRALGERARERSGGEGPTARAPFRRPSVLQQRRPRRRHR